MRDPVPDTNFDTAAWRQCRSLVDAAVRQQVHDCVVQVAAQVSDRFYEHMLADPAAGRLLDHAVVNSRLHAMMARWVRTLFSADVGLDEVVALQRHIGEVHARIGVSPELVTRGARLIKRSIVDHLAVSALPRTKLADAILYVYEWVDLALEAMNAAYTSDANRLARTDEAYRLLFVNQNMKAERERQRSQLLEWANQILVNAYWNVEPGGGAQAALGFDHSDFGLWLQHKASMLFENSSELPRIRDGIDAIERELLPEVRRLRDDPSGAREVVGRLHQHIDDIKRLLGSMFDRYIEVEDGRDSTTRLLNRRYFASVAKREIALAQRQGSTFALLLLDIDRFDTLRDALGLDGADMVLAELADGLLDSVRAGDFVFRIADDRFLVLLVEAGAASLPEVADGLRRRIEQMRLRTPHRSTTAVTVCVGAAMYDGHPDYQRLLDRAEGALREAQQQPGGNACVVGG